MPRERTTWNREEIAKKASLNKKADPYLMNQDHVKQQPSADKYVIGDPSDFAENVHPSKGTWEAEYANGQVKRNEIGMPEMRSDTFNHPEKTAAQVEAEIVKKAALAVNVAKAMLKSGSDSAIEDQATRLMKLSDEDLVATYKALVAEEDEEQDDDDGKQAGELPPWLKKDDDKEEKKDDDKEEKKAADQEQAQDKPEEKQAQDQGEQKQEGQGEQKQAQLDQVAQLSQMVAQLQQQVAQMVQQGQGQQVMPQVVQAQDQAQEEKKEEPAQDQKQAQMTQQAQAQMIQQAVQQALASGQDPVQAAQQAIQGCMSQPMADDGLLDEMLQQQEPVMAGEMGIELEAAAMDTGELSVTADDAILAQLFASQESQDAEQAQGGQQKQAAVRTASTRTVGTRPTQGVSTLGGIPSAGKGEKDLSNIWTTAPDVREVFGTR